jgi:hypothetical protein
MGFLSTLIFGLISGLVTAIATVIPMVIGVMARLVAWGFRRRQTAQAAHVHVPDSVPVSVGAGSHGRSWPQATHGDRVCPMLPPRGRSPEAAQEPPQRLLPETPQPTMSPPVWKDRPRDQRLTTKPAPKRSLEDIV